MSGKTKIEWATRVWNPVTGCTPVSAGCANCYAKRMHKRLEHIKRSGYMDDKPHFSTRLHHERLDEPLRWKKPQRVFVCSMGDLFHEDVPDDYIQSVFITMMNDWCRGRHTFIVLTKRPERMCQLLKRWDESRLDIFRNHIQIGVSVEDQKTADERIPLLLRTPAARRFVSYEPALGAVDFTNITDYYGSRDGTWFFDSLDHIEAEMYAGESDITGALDWVIMGGESGHGARVMHPDWARSTRDQCQAAGVPFFFKGWGEYLPAEEVLKPGESVLRRCGVKYAKEEPFMRVGKKAAGCLLDGKEWKEVPR